MNLEPFLIKGVFHVHTETSADCTMSPETIMERCLDAGVDVVAVTDHNEIDGARTLKARAPFQVIVGEEIQAAEGGHIIGLFLTERILPRQPARTILADIRAQGGLVYLPHPFDTVRTARWAPAVRNVLLPEADIIETFNGRNLFPSANAQAAEAARTLRKAPCAGADAHLPIELGRTVVFLPPFENPWELLQSLAAAHFICGRNLLWPSAVTKFVKRWRR